MATNVREVSLDHDDTINAIQDESCYAHNSINKQINATIKVGRNVTMYRGLEELCNCKKSFRAPDWTNTETLTYMMEHAPRHLITIAIIIKVAMMFMFDLMTMTLGQA